MGYRGLRKPRFTPVRGMLLVLREDARTYLEQVAERRGRMMDDLRNEVLVSDEEFALAHLS